MEDLIKALTASSDEIIRKLINNEKISDIELTYLYRTMKLIDRIKGDNKNGL